MTSTPICPTGDPEKDVGLNLTFAEQPSSALRQQHPHTFKTRERLRHFLHPDGKRIHVASSPEEAAQLRLKLAQLHPDDTFDVFISGTPEHLAALRDAQSHHAARQDELRVQHSGLYALFEGVRAELDTLAGELDRVTTHGVSLEAHFSKYGYGAHIKSYDEESPTESGATTPRSSISGRREKGQGSEVENGYATPLKLFKRPVVRQYFHKGILWRGSKSEEVQSFELFVDLLYVGIIAINGDAASEDPTGFALLRFVITFTVSFKIFNDMSLIISWFETDDIFQRLSILFLLACLFGFTTNITQAFDTTYATLLGFYIAARLFMASYLIAMAFVLPMIRGVMIWHSSMAVVGITLWIVSIHVPYPARLALIFVAIGVDTFSQAVFILLQVAFERLGPAARAWWDRNFEFWPALNIEHRTERMNSFVTLVFGYTVVAILYQSTVNGIDAFFGKGVLGLVQAFCFNWIYFEIDGSNLTVHAIRRHKVSAFVWSLSHLPFIMALVLGGGALARLVVATDTPESHLESLTPAYQARSEVEIRPGIRWFYCAGFGTALACMGLISISHVHKEMAGLRLRKRYRLVWRFAIALILVCLPLATGLDSLQLVGTVTGLVVFALGTELWASSCCNEKLMQRSRPCQYVGQCGKRQMEALVQGGKEVNVEELAGENGKNSGVVVGH